MNSCLLCLKNKSNLIKICSKKGKQLNCSLIIAKHFWFQQNILKDSKKSVCIVCWNIVSDFHQFYQTVAEAHKFIEPNPLDEKNFTKSSIKLYKLEENDESTVNDTFDPEIIVEANCLNLLPQIEIIENVENRKNQVKPLPNKDLNIKETLKRESSSSCDEDSDTEPLSMLLLSQTKATPKNKMSLHENETMSMEDETPKQRNYENHELHDSSADEDNAAITSESDSNPDSDYIPTEENIKTQSFQDKKLDRTIATYFESLQCTKCELSFPNFGSLRKHFKITHKSNSPTVECCGRKFYLRKALANHAFLHIHPEYLQCNHPKCDEIFQDSCKLKDHEETHKNRSSENKSFQCEQCPKTFLTKMRLKEHQAGHIPKSDFKFSCEECGLKYATRRRLWHHMRNIHSLENSIICDKCGKQARNRKALNRHMKKHSENPVPTSDPVQCDICGKWLKHVDTLRQHKRWVHKNRIQQHCPICKKVSPNLISLERHIFHSHKTKKEFQCTMCDKAFKYQRDLKAHTNLHTKEVIYTCDFCPKTFIHKSSLHKHKSNFHSNNQIEAPDPFQCTICSAWLKTLPGLKTHIKIRHAESTGEHRCHICGRVSVNAMALRRHIKRNHGIKFNEQKT